MPRIVVLDQVLKSWLFRFLTTKVDVLFIRQNPNRFLFQFRFECAITCSCWRSYSLLGNSAGGNTPQAAFFNGSLFYLAISFFYFILLVGGSCEQILPAAEEADLAPSVASAAARFAGELYGCEQHLALGFLGRVLR